MHYYTENSKKQLNLTIKAPVAIRVLRKQLSFASLKSRSVLKLPTRKVVQAKFRFRNELYILFACQTFPKKKRQKFPFLKLKQDDFLGWIRISFRHFHFYGNGFCKVFFNIFMCLKMK